MSVCAQLDSLGSFREFSFESEKSPVDEYREIAQRWEDMLAAEGQSVSENYANGRFALICESGPFFCPWGIWMDGYWW